MEYEKVFERRNSRGLNYKRASTNILCKMYLKFKFMLFILGCFSRRCVPNGVEVAIIFTFIGHIDFIRRETTFHGSGSALSIVPIRVKMRYLSVTWGGVRHEAAGMRPKRGIKCASFHSNKSRCGVLNARFVCLCGKCDISLAELARECCSVLWMQMCVDGVVGAYGSTIGIGCTRLKLHFTIQFLIKLL